MTPEIPNPAPQASAPDIYLLAAHPTWRESRFSRRLYETAITVPRVDANNLYHSYPDYAIDIAREQARMAAARLVVLLHPIQWYAMPALQKLWVDEVLSHGWAYGQGGEALRGKDLWLVASTGGPESAYHPNGYNRYFFEAFLPPYEQTAVLCGLRFLPPMILHGAHRASDDQIADQAKVFGQRLQSYPFWPELDDLEDCPACDVPRADRPRS